MSDTANEGRTVQESRRLALESIARYDRIGEVWDELTDREQDHLVDLAEQLASGAVLAS
jgi:hypothetical protein